MRTIWDESSWEEWTDAEGEKHRATMGATETERFLHVETDLVKGWTPEIAATGSGLVLQEMKRRGEELERREGQIEAQAEIIQRSERQLEKLREREDRGGGGIDGEAIGRGIVREVFQQTDPARPNGLVRDWLSVLGEAIGRGLKP